jgi:general stress protein 26
MNEEVLGFLDSKRIGVISVEMLDGSPHGATVHFAYQKDPLTFVFLTDRTYRKMEPLLKNSSTRASLVIGTDEDEMKTLQLDGIAMVSEDEEHKNAYFGKFPDKKEKYGGPDDVFFIFKPTWWRYTDYKAPEGKQVILSI